MAPLIEELAAAYKIEREYLSFEIRGVGSGAGLEAIAEGRADIAMVSRELAPEEKEKWPATLLAWDSLAIIVHPDNPVNSLTLDQIRSIFSGSTLSWIDAGGGEGQIQVVTREEGSGSRAAFQTLVLTSGERITSLAIVLPSDQAVGEYIARNPSAIGYASIASLATQTKPLILEGQEPTSQQYPLLRPFYLLIAREAEDEARDFINFCLSPRGQVIIGRAYRRAR
ncbi:MAG: phosphate ABC transporter substrate-binding protein [Chloroflexi bacterium]|nr:phosphate ABC transporter substrate-binding protein [Chloroflexota bacterium]